MKVVIRVDASIDIGTGHVMRCLALAVELRKSGSTVYFICRDHIGNLREVIETLGFSVSMLPAHLLNEFSSEVSSPDLYARWLGCPWEADANEVIKILSLIRPDWLVVDHYAIDYCWEKEVSTYVDRIFVIDDLSQREHYCNLLLDQNFGKEPEVYDDLLPSFCDRLIGPRYALLREEFSLLRSYALQRRKEGEVKSILVFLGGVDKDNATEKVLKALDDSSISSDSEVKVVLGKLSPWVEEIYDLTNKSRLSISVIKDTKNMAKLMANADLAIGAAGSTSWERCCLGLPTLMMILAENQILSAESLEREGVAALFSSMNGDLVGFHSRLSKMVSDSSYLVEMSQRASVLCDGLGSKRVSSCLQIA